MGERGSISFMGMLGHHDPGARFVVTCLLRPRTNADGPKEFLHIPGTIKLASVIAASCTTTHNRAA